MLQTDRLTNSANNVVEDIEFVVAQLVKCSMHKFVFVTTFEFCSVPLFIVRHTCSSQMFVTYIMEGQVTFPLLLPQPPLIMEGQVTFPFMLQHPLITEGQVKVKTYCLSLGQIWPHTLVVYITLFFYGY